MHSAAAQLGKTFAKRNKQTNSGNINTHTLTHALSNSSWGKHLQKGIVIGRIKQEQEQAEQCKELTHSTRRTLNSLTQGSVTLTHELRSSEAVKNICKTGKTSKMR